MKVTMYYIVYLIIYNGDDEVYDDNVREILLIIIYYRFLPIYLHRIIVHRRFCVICRCAIHLPL